MFSKTLSLLAAAFALAACNGGVSAANTASSETSASAAQTAQAGWRLSRAEMEDIANPDKQSWRIFYDRPSEGKDAAWFDAVKRGDLAEVRRMAENGQNLEAKDEASLGQTALGWAAFIGYEDMTDYLIGKGADLRATDRGDVYNVLKSAVLGKNTNIVKKVHAKLKAETDLNDQTIEDDGETLIMVAASNGRLETVKYLLEQGANPNLVSKKKNQSALSFACERGHQEVVQYLIGKKAVNHKTGKSNCQ
ncbi:ankyrin repeat domain-containing protein [Neisseria sp.]|uniref:ankyrin repeat domain-containing protein n=1 Tax=Neisseria sp. TaxID=192066 RepID=UPI0035A07002